MDSSILNKIAIVFNKYIKEVFHSSTLEIKVKEGESKQILIYATGYSNRLLGSIKKQYGAEYTDQLVQDIAVSNIEIFLNYLEEETGKKFEFISLKGYGNESHIMTLKPIK